MQNPGHMHLKRKNSGAHEPIETWSCTCWSSTGLQNRVDSSNGCRVSSIDERMYKRARGADVAGKRLPKQTTPKCTLPDEGWWATLYAEMIPFEQRLEMGRVYPWPCAKAHGHRQFGGATAYPNSACNMPDTRIPTLHHRQSSAPDYAHE